MKRLFMLIVFVVVLFSIPWSNVKVQIEEATNSSLITTVTNEITSFFDSDTFKEKIGTVVNSFQTWISGIENDVIQLEGATSEVEKPQLDVPVNQTFSIYNIEIGDSKTDVDTQVGEPKRISLSEYGVDWYTYHEDYLNYVQVMFDKNDKVVGLYTNQDLIASTVGVTLDTKKEKVQSQLGEPLTALRKGNILFQIQEDADYDTFEIDNTYVTVFYDVHENNTVTAIQIIEKTTEDAKTSFYAGASNELRQGFEYQMFDLTNATRVNHSLQMLTWDDHVKETARKHSEDMADNNYFDHTNLKGQDPFDRMKEDRITYRLAGENLAYGQPSSIFAHEGLMNSLGHRENILKSEYRYLGVGVAFNSENQPYYTQNYYAK